MEKCPVQRDNRNHNTEYATIFNGVSALDITNTRVEVHELLDKKQRIFQPRCSLHSSRYGTFCSAIGKDYSESIRRRFCLFWPPGPLAFDSDTTENEYPFSANTKSPEYLGPSRMGLMRYRNVARVYNTSMPSPAQILAKWKPSPTKVLVYWGRPPGVLNQIRPQANASS